MFLSNPFDFRLKYFLDTTDRFENISVFNLSSGSLCTTKLTVNVEKGAPGCLFGRARSVNRSRGSDWKPKGIEFVGNAQLGG